MQNTKQILSILVFILTIQLSSAQQSDWPMWRYDAGRTASTPEQLADKLYLQWQVKYSPRVPVWDDPLNQNLMQFDRIFEPIVADNKIFLGFNDQDKIIALDINTGKEIWHYYADGPVRMPLAANKGKIYFTSDDGNCYCVDGNSGSLIWKLSLAPGVNKLLGNKRLISMWPARGGIVIKDNILYTAASIFPLMGTFIYAIDTETGAIVWKNEGTGSSYTLQPHKSPAFANVAPQGVFTISGNRLLVAGGRSVPAAFDLKTGEELYYQLAESGKTGGAFTCGNEKVFFNHHRERMTYMYDSNTGNKLKSDAGEYPVLDGNNIYFSGKKVTASLLDSKNKLETIWKSDYSAANDLIKAGDCLYAADSTGITAIKISDNKPAKLWSIPTSMKIERLVAANGKLIAVSEQGDILVYGSTPVSEVTTIMKPVQELTVKQSVAENIVSSAGVTTGYSVLFGTRDLELLKGLLSSTSLTIIAYDNDPERITYLREYFDNMGVKADRLSFLLSDGSFPLLPKYFSSLTIINDLSYLNDFDTDVLKSVYECTRPYDGKIWMKTNRRSQKQLTARLSQLDLYGAEQTSGSGYSLITRTGSLEGVDEWTHNYGDISNTLKSDDERVKAPLGILWFGGNSNMDVLPRHGHGPGEQVIDGRLIIQGMNSISARDVYTGRVFWEREFEKLMDDTWLVYYDESYDEENPLDPKYNQEHLAGSNARGTNFIATKEYVYVIEGAVCHLIDIKTGALVKDFTTGDAGTQKLGYIGVYNDYLILGNNFTDFPEIRDPDEKTADKRMSNFDVTASNELIILNRFTGEKLWNIKANHGFIHNSVICGDDMLFCLDKLPQNLETKLKRRGEIIPAGSRLVAVDIKTGKIIKEETTDIFGTWLGYSSQHKYLLQATRPSRDMLTGETGNRMIVYEAGTMKKVWDKPIKYANPPILHNDNIYTEGEGFSLLTGDPIFEKDLLTGEEKKWSYKREYGCGIVVASEYLLTFRSASAGFINLETMEGTGSLGGWKASCSTNLIVADGVLNSPDYTRTCQCPYQNQTSLALVNMPWMTYWANSNYKWSGKQIKKLGLNMNAPGDRTSDSKVLWIEYPFVAGASPEIPVKLDTVNYFTIRKEPVSVYSESTPWISASAIGGVRSMEITLSKEKDTPQTTYRINLYFSELEEKKEGERVFNVAIQGNKVLENFDIISQTGKMNREIVRKFTGIQAGSTLKIEMEPVKGNTILSGIELVEEKAAVIPISAR
ncbi:MAG: PQQ-binding-like beta-propeller repeat protein [Bacteroidales bacterium]|nr:PQQ-binding-like beta-propeller repeat protein [Bacteroidales bacterium]